nr:uncharacterized protein LOC109179594 [Ipomoea batatas]
MDFDTLKFEEGTIGMFNRFLKAMKLMHFLELLFPLVLIPSAVKMSGEFVHELSVNLCNPHVVFLIGNAIIAVLFVLCRHTEALEAFDDSVRQGEIQPPADSCQVYAPPPQPETAEKIAVKAVAVGEEIKQIVCSESVVPKQQSEEIFVALQMATKQIQKLHRTQSEKLKRETAFRSQKDLRRSQTELRLKAVSSSATGTMASVENLSNEESSGDFPAANLILLDSNAINLELESEREKSSGRTREETRRHQSLAGVSCSSLKVFDDDVMVSTSTSSHSLEESSSFSNGPKFGFGEMVGKWGGRGAWGGVPGEGIQGNKKRRDLLRQVDERGSEGGYFAMHPDKISPGPRDG